MLTLEKAQGVLRERGMRVTPQRVAVLAYLEGNTNHPTADDVVAHVQEQMPTIAVSTVYSILHEFEDVGLIAKLDLGGVMHFDPQDADHAHLLCSTCKRIMDIELPSGIDKSLEGIVTKHGATLDHYHVDIAGICPACTKKHHDKPESRRKETVS